MRLPDITPPASDSTIVVEFDDDSDEGLALAAAEQAWLDSDYLSSIAISDSLATAWTRDPGVGAEPVRRLVRLLLARAEDVAGVEQLLSHPAALDESWRIELRQATERMSIAELDRLSRRITADERASGTVRAEHAWALARTGSDEAARTAARLLEGTELDREDRSKVEDVLAGRVAVAVERVRIGLVAPRTGGFETVGDQLVEGARLAAKRYERETRVPVEIVVVDEAAVDDTTGFALYGRSLDGVAGVVGPVRTEALGAAAAMRPAPGLLLLSPTASDDAGLPPHAYSIWDRARRDSLEATELGNWLVSAFEPARVAALYPDDESGQRRVRVFREIVIGAGFEWVGGRGYIPEETTHEQEIRGLTEADPDFVYAIADGPRQVLQVAPQLHFYGLRGRITLVNQDWTHPTIARRLDEPFSDYRVAAVYFERQENRAWSEFAAAWDEEYRRSLPDNAFAALAYDATDLILRSVTDPGLVRPAAVARELARSDAVQGVSGRFSFDPASHRIVRDARVRMLLHTELVDPDPTAISDWSVEARAQEELRLEQEEARERRRGGDR